jgi:hypothetical protein
MRVIVVTVFAGDPPTDAPLSDFARELHTRWQVANPTAERRAEDLHALKALHPAVKTLHLPLPECIYRRSPISGEALYASEEAIFGDVHSDDPALFTLCTPPIIPPGAQVYAPLGVGNHVDHQVVRHAAAPWGLELRCYEEYPYTVGDYQGAPWPAPTGWHREVTLPHTDALDAKVRALACYVSQISTFWENLDEMSRDVRTYEERVWHPAPSEE